MFLLCSGHASLGASPYTTFASLYYNVDANIQSTQIKFPRVWAMLDPHQVLRELEVMYDDGGGLARVGRFRTGTPQAYWCDGGGRSPTHSSMVM
jgi:hypothetical protein